MPTYGIIGTIVIGLLVGIVAKFLTPGRDPSGCIVTMLLGIAGAWLATWLGRWLDIYKGSEAAGFVGATVGAIIILLIHRLLTRKNTP